MISNGRRGRRPGVHQSLLSRLDPKIEPTQRSITSPVARALRAQLSVIKAMHDAGVTIVAGTDYGLPGFSLLRELELYVEAGLTPLDAIRSATVIPAAVMGMSADVGSITPGKRADLVVLDADPLADIHNLRTGRFVIVGGRMFDMAALRRAVHFGP